MSSSEVEFPLPSALPKYYLHPYSFYGLSQIDLPSECQSFINQHGLENLRAGTMSETGDSEGDCFTEDIVSTLEQATQAIHERFINRNIELDRLETTRRLRSSISNLTDIQVEEAIEERRDQIAIEVGQVLLPDWVEAIDEAVRKVDVLVWVQLHDKATTSTPDQDHVELFQYRNRVCGDLVKDVLMNWVMMEYEIRDRLVAQLKAKI